MKNLSLVYSIAISLCLTIIVIGSCKKKNEDTAGIDPSFSITATTVQLQSRGEGLQFFATSTNVDVEMTNAVITNPSAAQSNTYNFNGASFSKNQSFGLQTQNEAYPKVIGNWNFSFEGKLTSDGVAFSVNATFAVNN